MKPAAPDLTAWTHGHVFGAASVVAERRTRAVMLITAVMMVVEILAGWWFNSMALLADGWHMSSHALAIGLAAFAYAAARRYAHDPRFAFGTWKIEVLAGYSSALFLLGIAAWMVFGSVERLLAPQPIHYLEAIVVAVIGLGVNVACALILGGAHEHGDAHAHEHHGHHDHDHGGHGHDLNLKAAYLHVVADAATSVLAIAALAGGMAFGWNWLDPVMGIVGAALVALWAHGLIRETGLILLDSEMDHPVVAEVRAAIGQRWGDATGIADLHVWRVGKQSYACIVSLVTADAGITPLAVREVLAEHEELVHVSVEINRR